MTNRFWNPRAVRLALVLTLALALAACAPAYRGEPLAGPLATDDPLVALGERAYHLHCHSCHPGGAGGLGPALNDRPIPGFLIRLQVRSGLGAMPAFPPERLPDEELDAIVAYMFALRALPADGRARD